MLRRIYLRERGRRSGSRGDPWPTKSWPVSTPEEQGMDSASLARLVENVGTYKHDSLTIIRHGRIVTEAYYAPMSPASATT